MSVLTENELKLQIKSKNFENFYLLYGEENYLTENYTNLLISKILDENNRNLKSFIKNEFNIEELEKYTESVGFFSEKKCVLIKDLDFSAILSADVKKLKEILANLDKSTFVIISQINVEIDKKRTSSFTSFTNQASKFGAVLEFKKLTSAALEKELVNIAKKNGKELTTASANYLINSCGNDIFNLKNEIEKLCAYSPKEIKKIDIDVTAVKKLDANVFELTKLISSKKFKNSLEKLCILLSLKENPIAILSILSNYYIDLYRVKSLKNSGETIQNAKEIFDEYKNKEFRLTIAQKDCEKLSLINIKKILKMLLKFDILLKSSSAEKKMLLKQLFINIFSVYS